MTFEEELRRFSEGKGAEREKYGKSSRKAVEELFKIDITPPLTRRFSTSERYLIYENVSYPKMLRILERGKDLNTGEPIDVKNFDSTSLKTLEELHTEVREREVIMLLYESGVVECFSISTKTLVEAVAPPRDGVLLPGRSLHEVQRTYKKGDPHREVTITDMQEYAVSETLIKGEIPVECVVRGFKQELDIDICANDLWPFMILGEMGNYAETIRPSRVYSPLRSRKGNFWFRISFPEQFGPDEIIYEDHGTELMLRWI